MTPPPAQGWQLSGTSSDAYEELLVPAIFGPWAQYLVGIADLRAGERVLDVACGTGAVARAAASRVAPGGAVTAVDVNPTMLATARRTAPTDPAIDWRQTDATDLPFPDGTFNVVVCQQGLQFFDDRATAGREMRRVLTDSGRVAVAVWRGTEVNRPFGLLAEALARHSPTAGDMLRWPFGFGDREQLRALLTEAGFAQVRIAIRALVCRFPSPQELLRRQMQSSPLGDVLGELTTAAMDALVVDVDETLRPYVDDQGLAVPMETHIATATAAVAARPDPRPPTGAGKPRTEGTMRGERHDHTGSFLDAGGRGPRSTIAAADCGEATGGTESSCRRGLALGRPSRGSGATTGRGSDGPAGRGPVPIHQRADPRRLLAELEELGARRIDVGQPHDANFIPMADPEGNEFCVCPGVPLTG